MAVAVVEVAARLKKKPLPSASGLGNLASGSGGSLGALTSSLRHPTPQRQGPSKAGENILGFKWLNIREV